jgi:hypothetical protein
MSRKGYGAKKDPKEKGLPATHVETFGHQVERRTRETTDVPGPFNHGKLEAYTDSEEGNPLLACPFNGKHHAFRPSLTKSSWHENTPDRGVNWVTRQVSG